MCAKIVFFLSYLLLNEEAKHNAKKNTASVADFEFFSRCQGFFSLFFRYSFVVVDSGAF